MKRGMYILSLLFFAVGCLAKVQSMDYLCKKGGPIYRAHPTDCEKFVQCHRDASNNLIGEIRSCPFSTYWSKDILTCLPVSQVKCRTDKCADKPDGTVRSGKGNCRGFWKCSKGISEPQCCPLGQRFDAVVGCNETGSGNETCKDTCLGVEYAHSNETANDTVVCNKRPVVDEPSFYIEEATGIEYKRMCSPGTVYDQEACSCGLAKQPMKRAPCKREIYLPFTFDHKDMSINPYFVDNENVDVHNGSAHFNGENSRLNIPFFNNMEHVDSIVIRIKYISTSGKGSYPQVIISNSGCGFLPSIVISENEKDVIFEIATTKSQSTSISVPQPQPRSTEKLVEYKFLNETFIGSVNANASGVAVNGFLKSVQCDLSIGGLPGNVSGRLKEMANFLGKISEVSVYRCDPEQTR